MQTHPRYPKGDTLLIQGTTPEEAPLNVARLLTGPQYYSAAAISAFSKSEYGDDYSLMGIVGALREQSAKVAQNNLGDAEAMLMSQAASLNLLHGHLLARAARNIGSNIDFCERFMKLAFKAQNQCRMTLETLSNIKNPPVVYAKQANFNNGGNQQVNNGVKPTSHTTEKENPPNKLLEAANETPMDQRTTGSTFDTNPQLEAMAEINRASHI